MKEKERRVAHRSSIRVLVNCLPPGIPRRRNGHETRGWEMWARDIADDGVGLQWSSQWASARCAHCLGTLSGRHDNREICECIPPNEKLKKGQMVKLDGLVYTEKGSKPMQGRIQWVRPSKSGKTYEFGVHITSPNHRNFFKALES